MVLAEKVSCPADIVYQSLKHNCDDAAGCESQHGGVGLSMDATLHPPAVSQQPLALDVAVEDAAAAAGTTVSWCVADGDDTMQAARLGDDDALLVGGV